MTRSILIAAAFSIAALVAGAANAQTREDAQVSVSADHVDFNNARQTRAFYAKLTAAAKNVCTSEVSDPMTTMADAQCARQAVSDAVREINAPQLSALDGQVNDRASAYAMNDRQH
ncbi:UrcA family protein [Asticcacaulis benevestitus]|uniref:UrcA family protein n=1 Tax=Asticcacaulis benevestitus DSM 16100 = ATCC BAA-896 TaxID=1121022 RepID=V4Q9A3_9CAUL|nr:UrcA family protein [Asticcacaulis benevestitus]ESQ94445.1 hypothetical protein ABENE_01095 [Asticcacaulis benevestitus DSM 16100 = ATCC BAA-896]